MVNTTNANALSNEQKTNHNELIYLAKCNFIKVFVVCQGIFSMQKNEPWLKQRLKNTPLQALFKLQCVVVSQ